VSAPARAADVWSRTGACTYVSEVSDVLAELTAGWLPHPVSGQPVQVGGVQRECVRDREGDVVSWTLWLSCPVGGNAKVVLLND
jgi:hypothetical protein